MFVKLRMFAASLVICGKVVRAQLDVLSFEQPVVPRHVAKLGPDGYLLAVAKCDLSFFSLFSSLFAFLNSP